MYKVYRRSIFQYWMVWMTYVPYIVFFVYQRIVNGPFNIYVKGLVLYFGLVALFCASGFNYIILESERITFKNSFYFFWSKTFMYKDIDKIILKADHGLKPVCLRVVTHKKKLHRYIILSVRKTDLKKIAHDLKELNIELEIGKEIIRDFFNN